MLRPFLLVGIGGSGGKTLRCVREELERRLRSVGVDRPDMPACWQFLHIDVPTNQEGGDPDLPPPLPNRDYLGLVEQQVDYRSIDKILRDRSSSATGEGKHLDAVRSWHPRADEVDIPIELGAGQYRAVGRMISLARLQAVARAIEERVNHLLSPDVGTQLSELTRKFGGQEDDVPEPIVVVVCSLAGGSGSAAFLDVCDVLRLVGRGWGRKSFAVLYAPDVFSSLPTDEVRGVQPNALAALSELLAAYWDKRPERHDYQVFESAGLHLGDLTARGPQVPVIIGRSNGQVTFTEPNEVFRALGHAIAAWMVSERLQTAIGAYTVANWQQTATLPDQLGLTAAPLQQPCTAFGFARVSLGRSLFREYASRWIAYQATQRLRMQHERAAADADGSPELAVRERADRAWPSFLRRSRFDERGPEKNQVLEALLPMGFKERIQSIHRTTLDALASDPEASAEQWKHRIVDLVSNERENLLDWFENGLRERLDEWPEEVTEDLTRLVAETVAEEGIPVTASLLERLDEELKGVADELQTEVENFRRWADDMASLVDDQLSTLGPRQVVRSSHDLVDSAAKRAADCLAWQCEATLRKVAREVVQDARSSLVAPMRTALEQALAALHSDADGAEGRPPAIVGWPRGDRIPNEFRPARNEILVEDVTEFPDRLRTLLRQGTRSGEEEAVAEIVKTVIRGDDAWGDRLIEVRQHWNPSPSIGAPARGHKKALFRVNARAMHLLARARKAVTDPNTPLGKCARETFNDWLDEGTVPEEELEQRLTRLRDAFDAALRASAPLVSIDNRAYTLLYGESETTPRIISSEIPFPEGSRAHAVIADLLRDRGHWNQEFEKSFVDTDRDSIDLFSSLGRPVQPWIMDSLTGPIADAWAKAASAPDHRREFWRWRRARGLASAVPVPSETRRVLVRGWFTARLTDLISVDSAHPSSVQIFDVSGEEKWLTFPTPGLGGDPRKSYDVLPWLLESLPIHLVEYASRSDLSFVAPYRVLFSLGLSGDGGVTDYSTPNPALEKWLSTGRAAGGSPGDSGNLGGDASRRDEALMWLERTRKNYEDLFEEANQREFPPRAWELRFDIFAALDDLTAVLEERQLEVDDANW